MAVSCVLEVVMVPRGGGVSQPCNKRGGFIVMSAVLWVMAQIHCFGRMFGWAT